MTCDEYLARLAALPLDELTYGPARDHAATCANCARATRVVAERERLSVLVAEDLASSPPAIHAAEGALRASRQRKVRWFNRIGIGVATIATILLVLAERSSPSAPARITDTFRLRCLAPEQAAEVLRPILHRDASVTIRPSSPIGIVTVSASPADMAAARARLNEHDNATRSACAVQVRVPPQ